jgi:uncharacterized protein
LRLSRYNVAVDADTERFVYNGMSGALLRLTPEQLNKVEDYAAGDASAAPDLEVLRDLVLGRMLIPDSLDELELLERRYDASRKDPNRLGLTIVTSLGCNFACPYCYEAKHPSLLRPDVCQALLDLVDEKLPTISTVDVTWFGGEPLVAKTALLGLSQKLIDRCDSVGVRFSASLVTNGYLLDAATCQELSACRVRDVQVSLDGPADVHNRMRPLANGNGTFAQIVDNLGGAVAHFDVSVRVNTDRDNYPRLEELLNTLASAGLAGKLTIHLGQLLALDDGVAAPSAAYGSHRCFTNREFAKAREEFAALAFRYGFAKPSLPGPVGTPCTAVREHDLIVGSRGELYKCYESVGNPREVIGNILDAKEPNGRLQKWLKYNPFDDPECRRCIALPVCMGGCAHHAMDVSQYSNRCDTFRHTYREEVLRFVEERRAAGGVADRAEVKQPSCR